jgi:ABC-type multidrug transport system fused ATPase/permease subunit
MEGRTTFMIAHRLPTLEGCDMWLALDNGRLIELQAERMASAGA